MRGSRALIFWSGLLLAMLMSLGAAPSATATYSSDPVGPSGWVPDGPVHSVAVAGSRVFVGGGFSGGVAALDAATGSLLWSGHVDGDVRALAVSADGTHLIAGGGFTSADGARHRHLASLRVADGTVEPRWRASAGGMVRDLVVVGDVAYFGGTFKQHDGLEQRGLGAVLVSTGKPVAAFDPATDANVYALATDGVRLFVGGRFTRVSGQVRNGLASVALASNTVDGWAPARVCDRCNLYWDLVVDGGTVYGAGRNGGAVTAFSSGTGAQRWRVVTNGDAQALAMADGLLYAGGHFVTIGGQSRTILAALDPATGAVDPDFRSRFVTTYPGIWALAATSSRLYVGGDFTAAGPTPNRYPYFAIFQ